MKILILGAGKMGSFFSDLLSFNHDVAVMESDSKRMRFVYNVFRCTKLEEVEEFAPELVINCVTLSYTVEAFKALMPHLPQNCIISDIASVKTGLKEFYEASGFRYVSVHPMFGPTFANLGNLQSENAIIINEPQVKENGALNAIMSGSGPTVFGLFDDEEKAKEALSILGSKVEFKQGFVTTFAKYGIKGIK